MASKTFAKWLRTLATLAAISFIAGCGQVANVRDEAHGHFPVDADRVVDGPAVVPAPRDRVRRSQSVYIPVSVKTHKGYFGDQWLESIPFDMATNAPVQLSAFVASLGARGVNVVSSIPLDSYTYAGNITGGNAALALKQVLWSLGLDYTVEPGQHLVSITPVGSETWNFGIGVRKSRYESNSTTQPSDSGSGNSSSTASTSPMGMSGGSSQGGTSASNGMQATSSADGVSRIESESDFWDSMEKYLSSRLKLLVPDVGSSATASIALPLPPPLPMAGSSTAPSETMGANLPMIGKGTSGYREQAIGTFSINQETGTVTVQAPRWLLRSLATYMDGIKRTYNTSITLRGEIVTLELSDIHGEGFDISSFGRFASGRFGAVVSNNALGGLTVSMPTADAAGSVQLGNSAIGGGIVGVVSRLDGLQVFNAYLQRMGTVDVRQRPIITTTTGVPGTFANAKDTYFNLVSQQAAAGGTGGTALATQNTLNSRRFGVDLRVNPRYSPDTGLVRADISLVNTFQSGTQPIQQTVSTPDGGVKSVTENIPLSTRMSYSGEAVLRDGDLIILGGQTVENASTDEAGVPGARGNPLAGVLGNKKSTKTRTVYYFALSVSLHHPEDRSLGGTQPAQSGPITDGSGKQ